MLNSEDIAIKDDKEDKEDNGGGFGQVVDKVMQR